MLEKIGLFGVLKGAYQAMPFLPLNKLISLINHWTGVAYDWYLSFYYFSLLELHHHYKASHHPIISKFMHHIYFQDPFI